MRAIDFKFGSPYTVGTFGLTTIPQSDGYEPTFP